MIADLQDLPTYGSEPENEDEHHWVKIFEEVNSRGFFVLTACHKCGMLARKQNSNEYEYCVPGGEWNRSFYENCPSELSESYW